jgi:hypothetical protein
LLLEEGPDIAIVASAQNRDEGLKPLLRRARIVGKLINSTLQPLLPSIAGGISYGKHPTKWLYLHDGGLNTPVTRIDRREQELRQKRSLDASDPLAAGDYRNYCEAAKG